MNALGHSVRQRPLLCLWCFMDGLVREGPEHTDGDRGLYGKLYCFEQVPKREAS